jgi:SOS response regulatory protein OraA/RecX
VVELDQRLARAGVPRDTRTEILERMRAARYLDDGRVALDRAGRLAGRGLGDAAIRADLAGRGVPPDLAEQAVSALEPEVARAARLAVDLGGGPRAARTLARKGFEAETIERVVEAVADDV